MKHLKFLPPLLLLVIASSAEALDGRNCLEQSTQLKPQERTAFLTNCLARASAPSSAMEAARQSKALRCSDNARNLELEANEMMDYIKTCLTRNEAAEAVARMAAAREKPVLASTTRTDFARQ